MLEITGLSAGYQDTRVLHELSLTVAEGEIVTVLGANGAGKTTLLRTIAGLLRAQSGEMRLQGRSVTGLSPDQLVRAGISLVPEGRLVVAPLTVRENLQIGAYTRPTAEARRSMAEVETLFPRLTERRHQIAGMLSGGEQQMLAIGRALMAAPRLLLLDEPSMGLAPLVIDEIFQALAGLNEHGHAVLLVEQNARKSVRIAHRGYVMESGRFVLEGSAEELARSPVVVQAYLGE